MSIKQWEDPQDIDDSLFVQEPEDWRKLHLYFLLHIKLPTNRPYTMKNKTKSSGFFIEEGFLFPRGFS